MGGHSPEEIKAETRTYKKTICLILGLTMFFFAVLMSISMGNYLSRPDVENPGAASVVADDDHGAEEAHVP